jgi:hypothetical protein
MVLLDKLWHHQPRMFLRQMCFQRKALDVGLGQ